MVCRFYFFVNIGSLLAVTVIVWVQVSSGAGSSSRRYAVTQWLALLRGTQPRGQGHEHASPLFPAPTNALLPS